MEAALDALDTNITMTKVLVITYGASKTVEKKTKKNLKNFIAIDNEYQKTKKECQEKLESLKNKRKLNVDNDGDGDGDGDGDEMSGGIEWIDV